MYILFDIGGSKMRIASSPDLEEISEPYIVDTPAAYEEGVKTLFSYIAQCANGADITAICGGIAGPFSQQSQTLINGPHLQEWVGKPLHHELEHRYGVPVYIENDSALVGLGEATHGAGVGHSIVAYLTVSTGVGGARIVDGTLDEQVIGFEPGHQIIDIDQSAAPHAQAPTLQSYISGTAIRNRYGMPAEDIPADDPLWDDLAYWLAAGITNTVVHWSPDVVVLGGSMIIGDPAIDITKVQTHLSELLTIYNEVPPLTEASLEHVGGLYGALTYLSHIEGVA